MKDYEGERVERLEWEGRVNREREREREIERIRVYSTLTRKMYCYILSCLNY